jgi:hypothetical protein
MEAAKLPFFLGGFALFFLVETLAAERPWQAPRGKRLGAHALMAIFNQVALKVVLLAPFLAWSDYVFQQE